MKKIHYTIIASLLILLGLSGGMGPSVLAQEYGSYQLKITIEDLVNWGRSSCITYFRIYQSKGGRELTLQEWEPGSVGEDAPIYARPFTTKVYTIRPDAKPDYIGFYGKRGWKQLFGGCKFRREGGDGYGLDYNKAYINVVLSKGDHGEDLFGGYTTKVALKLHPLKIDLLYFDANNQQATGNQNNLLPVDDKITLKATKGFSSATYNWQYSINNITWTDFPATVQYADNKSEVTFKGTDLFSDNEFKALIGSKNLFVRINTVTEQKHNAIVLYPCLSAPHFRNVSYQLETCHGSGDATVSFTMDRALVPGEVVYIQTNNQVGEGQGPVELDASYTTRITGVSAGSYDFTLKSTLNGQLSYTGASTHKSTLVVENRPLLTHVVESIKPVSCFNGTDGAITITAAGGNGQYVGRLFAYGQSEALQAIRFSATEKGVFSRLRTGAYRVEVFDTHNCTAYDGNGSVLSHTVDIKQPLQPVAVVLVRTISPLAFASSDGEATIRVHGGTQAPNGYAVSWRSEQGEPHFSHSSSRDGEAFLYTFKGLHRGKYYITVEDNHYASLLPTDQEIPCGCSDTLSFYLTAPPLLEVKLEKSHHVHCNGSNEGVLTAHAKGGVPTLPGLPYTYIWYRFTGGSPQEISYPNDSVAPNLTAGTYQVKITDANQISTLSDPFVMTEPDSLQIRFQTTHIGCSNVESGKIESFVSGGTPPYTYQWNKEGETQSAITALEAGIYLLKVVDKNNCLLTATTEVKAPGGLKVDTVVTHPSCLSPTGGAIELTLSGATPPYTVTWADSPSTERVRKNLPPGTYYATVTDANGCNSSYSFTLQKPREFRVELGESFTMCRGESRTLRAVSQEPDLTYVWYWNDSRLPDTAPEITVAKEGTYRVIATNAQGCFAEDEIPIRMGQEPLKLDFSVPTVIAVNSDTHAVNISTVTADQIRWHFPPDTKISKQTDVEAVFSIAQKGTYTLTMEGLKGDCTTLVTRTIEVVNAGEVELPDGKLPLIKQFLITPNPTTGYFKVLVELARKEDFAMLLYSPSGFLMDKKEVLQTQSRTFEYEINGSALGTYLLHLQTPNDQSVLKIVVTRN